MARLDFSEIGSTGLKRSGGVLQEEFLKELRGSKAVKVYQEMSSNDPVIGAVLFAIDMLIRRVTWTTEPGGDSPEDKEAAEFIDSCRSDMSTTWADTISEILSMLVFGWSWHETVFKLRLGDSKDPTKRSRFTDGRIGWRKLPIRAQESLTEWKFDEEGGIQAMVQTPAPDYLRREIPIEKSLLFRTKVEKGSPEGRSILRNAYRPWYFKRRIEEIEGIGVERDLAGLPVAWVPPEILNPSASAEQKAILNAVKDIVQNVKRDEQEGMVFPMAYDEKGNKTFDFSLLGSTSKRNFDTGAIVVRYDQRIAMTVLADFILIGHLYTGSYSLSADKTDLFATAISSWLQAIAEPFNRFLIPRTLLLNNMRVTAPPKLVPGKVERVNLKDLGEFVKAISGAGAPLFPDDALENHLRTQAGMPEKPVEETV